MSAPTETGRMVQDGEKNFAGVMVRETEVVCHKSDESIFAGKITFFKAGKPAGRDMENQDDQQTDRRR